MSTTITKTNQERTETNAENNTHNIKHTIRTILKDGNNLSLLKVVGTALTAVSMALISSQLTGFINSLILVGLVSVGSAFLSEFYRVVLSVTSLGAKKIVPGLRSNSNETASTDEDTHPTVDLDSDVSESKSSWWNRLRNYSAAHPTLKFSALFLMVSMLTIGSSYLISASNVSTDSNYTTVHTTTMATISEDEKHDIINLAAAKAHETEKASSDESLKTRITELEKQNAKLQAELDTLKESKNYDETIKSLQDQITVLKKQQAVSTNNNSDNSHVSESAPTVSPTVSNPEPSATSAPNTNPVNQSSNSSNKESVSSSTNQHPS